MVTFRWNAKGQGLFKSQLENVAMETQKKTLVEGAAPLAQVRANWTKSCKAKANKDISWKSVRCPIYIRHLYKLAALHPIRNNREEVRVNSGLQIKRVFFVLGKAYASVSWRDIHLLQFCY
jgi:hypothetical protein